MTFLGWKTALDFVTQLVEKYGLLERNDFAGR